MGEVEAMTGSVEDPTGDPQWVTPVEEDVEHVTPIDMDENGSYDAAFGYLVTVGEFALLDQDTDGRAEYIEIDTDGDGMVDVTLEDQGDDTWLVNVDHDGDTLVDSEFTMTSAEIQAQLPELWKVLSADPAGIAQTPEPADDGAWTPEVVDGQIVGDPFQYSDLWFQQAFDGSCLPASVAQIYALYTGDVVSDLAFVDLANQVGGWIVGEDGIPGMAPEAAVQLLESAGIDASLQTGDLDALTTALHQGYSVMVAVDSGEIWYGEEVEDQTMDHALLVAGIDTSTGVVYLSDTGTAEGNMLAVPLETFMDSWADSGNTMVVTEETVAEHRAEVAGEPADDGAVPDGGSPDGQLPYQVPDPADMGPGAVTPGDVTQVPPEQSGAADTGDLPFDLSDHEVTEGLPESLERYQPTPLEQVVRSMVSNPWILLPVALVGARLVSKAAG